MNFQNSLLNRRGRFGTIWLAAHHPGKVGKYEVITLDLSEKCEEIVEFVVNGTTSRPRFSLFVSSHLMYGLCVLLKKKNQYLYDDLCYLNQEINKAYIGDTLVVKQKKPKILKTPKKVQPSERQTITLNENLPEFDITAFDINSFLKTETARLEQLLVRAEHPAPSHRAITMEDTFEISETSFLIQAQDYLTDSFGVPTDFSLRDQSLLQHRVESLEYTVQAPEEGRQKKREPFKELSINEQIRRAEQHTTSMYAPEGGLLEETNQYTEIENLIAANVQKPAVSILETEARENIPPEMAVSIGMPELFQETVAEAQISTLIEQPTVVEPIPQEIQIEPALVPVERAVEPIPQEIQVEPAAEEVERVLEEPQVAIERPIRRRLRRRGPIIDYETELPREDLTKRIRLISREEEEQEENVLDRKFARQRFESFKTRHDFLMQDLFQHQSSLLMRKTNRIYRPDELKKFVSYQINTLKTSKQPDDTYFYTTEARSRRRALEVTPPLPAPVPVEEIVARRAIEVDMTVESELERGRMAEREKEGAKVSRVRTSEIDMTGSRLRKSSFIEKPSEGELQPATMLQFEESASMQIQEQFQEQAQFYPPAPGPEVTFETPIISIQAPTPEKVAKPVEINEFEKIILDEIQLAELKRSKCILQDVIKTRKIENEKCLNSNKPRRAFACKLFSAVLNMAKENIIKVNQDGMYSPIALESK